MNRSRVGAQGVLDHGLPWQEGVVPFSVERILAKLERLHDLITGRILAYLKRTGQLRIARVNVYNREVIARVMSNFIAEVKPGSPE